MKMVMMVVVSAVVFAACAAGGWYAKTQFLDPPADDAGDKPPVDLTADPMEPATNAPDSEELMPVAVRDRAMSVEELLRFSLSLKERERLLREEEELFQQRQVQEQLVLGDIKAEQEAIDGLRSKLSTDLASSQSMIDELNRLRDTVISEREKTKRDFGEIEAKQIDISEQYKANDKKLSTWLQGMSSEKSAAVLKEMANDGDMSVAVQILSNFEEREAAKILDSIDDPKLLNEFIAEFRNLKNQRTAAKPGKGGK